MGTENGSGAIVLAAHNRINSNLIDKNFTMFQTCALIF